MYLDIIRLCLDMKILIRQGFWYSIKLLKISSENLPIIFFVLYSAWSHSSLSLGAWFHCWEESSFKVTLKGDNNKFGNWPFVVDCDLDDEDIIDEWLSNSSKVLHFLYFFIHQIYWIQIMIISYLHKILMQSL